VPSSPSIAPVGGNTYVSVMTDVAREIAPDLFCLGPWGRTQTNVHFVRSGPSWVLIDAGWAKDVSRIERAACSLFDAASSPSAVTAS
jgi:hypothetical protein